MRSYFLTAVVVFAAFFQATNAFNCQCLDRLDNETPDQFVTDVCCSEVGGIASGVDCEVSFGLLPQIFEECCEFNDEDATCS